MAAHFQRFNRSMTRVPARISGPIIRADTFRETVDIDTDTRAPYVRRSVRLILSP